MPNRPTNMAPTTAWGRVAKMAPNLPTMGIISMTAAPQRTTRRLATRVKPMEPMFSE